jgi:hypothetical protein
MASLTVIVGKISVNFYDLVLLKTSQLFLSTITITKYITHSFTVHGYIANAYTYLLLLLYLLLYTVVQ